MMPTELVPELGLLRSELSPALRAMTRTPGSEARSAGRILLVDSLRGFALLGLFLVHCLEYFELYWRHPERSHIHNAVDLVFADKAYAVFALLFGLSFFLIMDRQARKGVDFSRRFAWRLLLLAGIGYLYSLIYVSEILQVLALLGLSLLLFNKMASRSLLILSFLFLLQPHLLFLALSAFWDGGRDASPVQWAALYARAADIFAQGSFWQVAEFNLWQGQMFKWFYIIESPRIASFGTLFIWGLLLGRIGFFAARKQYLPQRRWILTFSLVAAALLYAGKTDFEASPLLVGSGNTRIYLLIVLESWLAIAVAISGVLIFMEAYEFRPLRRLAVLLAPCGQMSLTIYVAQGLLCVPLFYGYGLGWYQHIGQERALLFGLLTFAAMAWGARLWIRHFRYGPLEWLWRCGTYCSLRVPLRRSPA